MVNGNLMSNIIEDGLAKVSPVIWGYGGFH